MKTVLKYERHVSNLVKDIIADFEGVRVFLDPDGHHEAEEEGEAEDEEIPRRVEVHKLWTENGDR